MNGKFPIIPIGKDAPSAIPWDMIKPHEQQARANHCGQGLIKLAQRGGLSPDEALAVLEDRGWLPVSNDKAAELLNQKVRRFYEPN